ncbi:MAG: hypothetical protein J6R41_10145 [Paludibacteraceae bacterium]|nr:hypothetical protein [Paludibacteraceae bacterium]
MSERNKVVPDSMLSKEFLSQFKTEADVCKFLKQFDSLLITIRRTHVIYIFSVMFIIPV